MTGFAAGLFDGKFGDNAQLGVALKRLRKTRPRIPKTHRLRQSALNGRDVTRVEFNHIIDLLNERGEIVKQLTKELEIQFKRMARDPVGAG